MNWSALKIILLIGIVGLIANIVAFCLFGLLVPFITSFVGYLATKKIFTQTPFSENPPTFGKGAKIGLMSGAIATGPILLGGVWFMIEGAASNSDMLPMGMLIFIIILLVLGSSIVLSTLTGGITAAKLLRKSNQPISD